MASIADNQAAWLPAPGKRLEISKGPDQSSPAEDEVIIRTAYAAVNPVDWKIQDYGIIVTEYPAILGADVAGEVVSIGSKVTRFSPGDRVIAHATTRPSAPTGADKNGFQLFSAAHERVVAKIPDSLPFSHAAVLPLAISTASTGLHEFLGLAQPSIDPSEQRGGGKTLLVWGASSSIGTLAIQLARGAGYEVVATASKRNFEYARNLGVSEVWDYGGAKVEEEIIGYLKREKKDLVGVFDAISGNSSIEASAKILKALGGGKLSVTLPPAEPEKLPKNVGVAMVVGNNPAVVDDFVATGVWRDYVPAALAGGQLLAKPDPIVVEGGLAAVQEAFDLQKKGVSAAKIVVKIA